MASDEDDEIPEIEPRTSSYTQPPVPVLPLQSGSTSSSHGPSTSTSSEDESADNDDGEGESGPAVQSARSHDCGRTVLYPGLYVLTNDEHLDNDARSTHVRTENGELTEIYNLTSIPGVQRSLCLDEVIDDPSSTRVEFPEGVDKSNQRHAGTLYGHLWKRCRSESQEEILCSKRSVIPGSTRIPQAVC